MVYHCSLIIPPNRWVNREPVNASNMYDAYLEFKSKYSVMMDRFNAIVLVNRGKYFRYYDVLGKILNTKVMNLYLFNLRGNEIFVEASCKQEAIAEFAERFYLGRDTARLAFVRRVKPLY